MSNLSIGPSQPHSIRLQGQSGTIPCRVWIGVTGHRDLELTDPLLIAIRDVLGRIDRLAASTGARPRWGVVSPLAEGADQVLARAILDEDGQTALEAVLPLPPEEYMEDFRSVASRQGLRELLDRADLVTLLPACRSRLQAYVRVGDHVLERSDVLVALWDGQPVRGPGGTASVVQRALARRMPTFWIDTANEHAVYDACPSGKLSQAFKELGTYNELRINPSHFAEETELQHRGLNQAAGHAGCPVGATEPFLQWIIPCIVRAEHLALRYRNRSFRAGYVLLTLAALALLTGVSSAFSDQVQLPRIRATAGAALALLEALLLVSFLLVWLGATRTNVRARWLSCRSLAERCRIALFASFAGLGWEDLTACSGSTRATWADRAFAEVWMQRPRQTRVIDVEPLKRFLLSGWIGEQHRYYKRRAAWHLRRHDVLSIIVYALFALTVAVVLTHALDLFGGRWRLPLVFTSIVLGTSAGFVGGIQAQYEYQENYSRYQSLALELEKLWDRMAQAEDLAFLQDVAGSASVAMLAEHRNWSGVMQVRNFDLSEYA